jgi:glycosyltransferase involved in cell wall biosynthesis
MNILLTNYCLDSGTGTEMFLYDLCQELTVRGHQCAVYTTRQGPLADEFRAVGISVIDRFSALQWTPDVLHCQHSIEVLEAISCFKKVPALYLCHDATAKHDQPPPASCLERCIAISKIVRTRVERDAGLPANQIGLAFNAVNTRRFWREPQLRPANHPGKALIFHSNLTSNTYMEKIDRACRDLGIQLDEAGYGGSRVIKAPEVDLPQYDVVFTTGRCAIEAMACGCAVILAGGEGIGPLVRTDNIDSLREANFGRSLLSSHAGSDWIKSEISSISRQDVVEVAWLIRKISSLEKLTDLMLSEYKAIAALGTQSSLSQRQVIAHSLQIQRQSLEQPLTAKQSDLKKRKWVKSDELRTAVARFIAVSKALLAGAV